VLGIVTSKKSQKLTNQPAQVSMMFIGSVNKYQIQLKTNWTKV
jgi:hypothetical protein